MYVNCSHGKGIKFIREDLKFFAKTHINSNGGNIFKSIVLLNADKLTIDAQSALRRCIEQFSFNTRFFIITDNKYKLLKPILSRFCEIYISSPINLHSITMDVYEIHEQDRVQTLHTIMNTLTEANILSISQTLYDLAYSALDLAKYIESSSLEPLEKYTWILYFYKIKGEFRNESLLLFVLLHLFVFRKETLVKLFI
jgi:DNA polymerase III delta prime subunit